MSDDEFDVPGGTEDVFEVPEGTEYRYLVQDEAEEEVQYVRPYERHYVSPFLVLSRRCIFLICVGIAFLLSLAGYLAVLAQTLPPGVAVVSTDCGQFRGKRKDGAFSFKGIPYAAPPTGDLRWLPPAKPVCHSGVTDATRFRSACPQVQPLSATGRVMGSENCLFLNVWTPSPVAVTPGAGLAVMVWIHGGYLHILSGAEPGYSPTERLAAQTNMVYVSFNYRLNAFGFLALKALREGSPTNTSGNYGFMDQIAALQWVQRNIHAFGGDPNKVTIFGQSSGGTSVWTLMMSPLAKGLFRAAVDQSGSYVYNASLEEAEASNLVFLNKTRCSDLACLRTLSITQILQAIPWKEYPSWGADDLVDLPTKGRFVGPVAVVDGHVLQAPPFKTWENQGVFNDVPFLIGTTAQEVDFYPPYENISDWTWGDYRWFASEKLKLFGEDIAEQALVLYNSSAPCPTTTRCPEFAFTTMVSDMRVTCPNSDLARRAAATLHSPVYHYVVTHTPSRAVNNSEGLWVFPSRFAFHGLDSFAFFGSLESILGGSSPEDRAFQDLLTQGLVHFANNGKMPASWPEAQDGTALLSNSLTVVNSYSPERCKLWNDNGFYKYAWVN